MINDLKPTFWKTLLSTPYHLPDITSEDRELVENVLRTRAACKERITQRTLLLRVRT